MARPERPLSPFMQYRWQYTNTLSILHRVTGVLLAAGFLLLVYWLVAAARGPDAYARALECLASVPVKLLLLAVLWSYCFHFLNGIRHLFWDLGLGFELRTARASGWAVALASVALAAALWYALCHGAGGMA